MKLFVGAAVGIAAFLIVREYHDHRINHAGTVVRLDTMQGSHVS
jgi:hypothetical protein